MISKPGYLTDANGEYIAHNFDVTVTRSEPTAEQQILDWTGVNGRVTGFVGCSFDVPLIEPATQEETDSMLERLSEFDFGEVCDE